MALPIRRTEARRKVKKADLGNRNCAFRFASYKTFGQKRFKRFRAFPQPLPSPRPKIYDNYAKHKASLCANSPHRGDRSTLNLCPLPSLSRGCTSQEWEMLQEIEIEITVLMCEIIHLSRIYPGRQAVSPCDISAPKAKYRNARPRGSLVRRTWFRL
jgi:hypothetical protein